MAHPIAEDLAEKPHSIQHYVLEMADLTPPN